MKTIPSRRRGHPSADQAHLPGRRPERGIALFLTLVLLVVITIIVVGFTVSMRTERMASNSMSENERSKLVARSALVHATSLLVDNIPDPAAPDQDAPTPAYNWFVNPGRLTLVSQNGTQKKIALYSGEAAAEQTDVAVNLNAMSPVTKKYPITGSPDPMWVSWVNMLSDPSTPASASNPVVGRYAFWIDDESAKINFNVARGKPANLPMTLPPAWGTATRDLAAYLSPRFTIGSGTTQYILGQPASINLDTLGVDIDALQTDIAKFGFARTPEAIKSYVQTDSDSFYEKNKFSLTAFSRSPEFNVFGKPRIFMAAAPADLGAGPMFQHTLHPEQPVQFFGSYSAVGDNTDADAYAMRALREPVFQYIAKYLNRSDWPGFSGRKFEWVSAPIGNEETDQIAANITGMGYWATTSTGSPNFYTNTFYRYDGMAGAYGPISPPNRYLWRGPISGRPTLPFYVGPQLTEVTCTLVPVQVNSSGTSPYYLQFKLGYEFYVPPSGFSNSSTEPRSFLNNSTNNNYLLAVFPTYCSINVLCGGTTTTNVFTGSNIQADTNSLSSQRANLPSSMLVDSYAAVLAPTVYVSRYTVPIQPAASGTLRQRFPLSDGATINVKLRLGIVQKNSLKPMMVTPIYAPNGEGTLTSELKPESGEDDTTLASTFVVGTGTPDTTNGYTRSLEIDDARNYAVKSAWKDHAITVPGDEDSLGFENSNFGGTPSAQSKWGMWNLMSTSASYTSPSFRGTSIGMFSFIPTGMRRGLPWKTLRFHDYSVPNSELPDWLVLDLFAPSLPPLNSSSPVSYMNSTAGKINLNSKIYPQSSSFAPPARITPLNALFENMPHGEQIVDEIVKYQDAGGYFDYIGRICEVSKVADSTQGTLEFDQEVIVRNLASLFTTQSNVFSIWGVAQTVKKSVGGKNYGQFESGDAVTGEKRFYAVVERSVWPGRDGVPGAGTVTDGNYSYLSSNPKTANAPGAYPSGPWVTSGTSASASIQWGRVDGPQAPEAYNGAMGSRPYTASGLAEADNPLAPVMKYRIIYFKYLQ